MKFNKIFLAMALFGAASMAQAADTQSGAFLGFQAAHSKATNTHTDIDDWYYSLTDYETDDSSAEFGLRGGYNWVSGSFIYGVTAEYSWGDLDTETEVTPGDPSYTAGSRIDGLGSVRGKLGYVSGPFSVYATAGFAFGDVQDRQTETDGSGELIRRDGDGSGVVFGVGVEYASSENSSWGLEYSRYRFGESTHEILESNGASTGYFWNFESEVETIAFSYNYHF